MAEATGDAAVDDAADNRISLKEAIMKSVLALFFVGALCTAPALGQSTSDSSAVNADTSSQRSGKFVDKDGNGIDDRKEGKVRGRGKDKFIDADGDGICDGRENGLGFRGGKGAGAGRGRQWRGGKK